MEAFNVRDMKALDDLIAPAFEFHPYLATLIEASVYRGCDGLRSYFAESDEAWGHLHARLDEVHEVGDHYTISYGEIYGMGRASGMEVRVPLAWVAEWRDGKLVRLVSYTNKQQARDAVGLRD
ncbi:MAG: hypothetical protein NVS1B9_03840 [Solirubrobacteraceae bacterium]